MRAAIFGASGGLATQIARALLARGWHLDLVTRAAKRADLERDFRAEIDSRHVVVSSVERAYSEFASTHICEAYFFAQALFDPKPFVAMGEAEIAREVEVGLLDVLQLTRKLLGAEPPTEGSRRDYCFIGSTSAYSGFKNTAVYCAVKHGLLGFVRALNDEYAKTDTRFWLFSMGTMNTEMGRRLVDQDATSFLQPDEVAERIAETIASRTNIFEPEVLIRRRTVRYLEK